MLKQQLQEELKQSMLARDELKTSVLRMLLSAVGYFEIQKGGAGYSATNDDVLYVIDKQAKQRRDSIDEFKKASRYDLADKEAKELELLQKYLPAQMTDEELKKIIDDTIREVGAKTPADMGKTMGVLVSKLKGKADMSNVSQILKEKLSKQQY